MKKKKAFSGRGQNIWSTGKHLKLPWLKSHFFFSHAVTKWHLKTARLRVTYSHIKIIQLKSLFLLDKGRHRCNSAQIQLRLWCLFGLRVTRQLCFLLPSLTNLFVDFFNSHDFILNFPLKPWPLELLSSPVGWTTGWVARPKRQERGKAMQTLWDLFTQTGSFLVGDKSW